MTDASTHTRRRIAVLRALGGIGDVLTALPALTALRAAEPSAYISYIALPQVEPLLARFKGLIDRFIAFPGFPGIPEVPFNARRLHAFLDMRSTETPFDLVYQMHGSGSVSNVFAALLGGRRTTGYFIPGLWCPDESGFHPFPDHLSESQRWAGLVEKNTGVRADAPPFPLAPYERAIVERLGLSRYAVIHAGASDPARRWPTARFAYVADYLSQNGLEIVLTGSEGERAIANEVAAQMRYPARDLSGQSGLGEAAALIAGAAITVTNDTGPSHIAASLGAPSVVIFIASDPARWAPADADLHRVVGAGVPDIPAGHAITGTRPSLPDVEAVISACDEQLAVLA